MPAPRVDPHPCEHCGATTRNPRFCGNACHLSGTWAQRSARLRKPRPTCPQCGVGAVMRGAKTCSRSCSDAMRRRQPDPCRRCGSCERGGRRRGGPYCPWACFNEDRYQRTGSFARWIAAWTSGQVSGTTENGKPDDRVRQALVFLRGSSARNASGPRSTRPAEEFHCMSTTSQATEKETSRTRCDCFAPTATR